MLSQKATQLSINDNDQAASDSTLQNETPRSSPRGSPIEPSASDGNIFYKFKAAAKALPAGTLVRDDSLSLYDAVGSLEIMDPKMDSGLLLNRDSSENEYDVLQELGPKQVLGVMDELLGFEMSWHQGFPLYRNLLASHYIERLLYPPPADINEATFTRNAGEETRDNPWLNVILRAYCLAVIKTCDLVNRQVASEKYHEEEDFNTNTHERELLSAIEIEPVQGLLEEAFHLLGGANDTDVDKSLISAVSRRLELRQYILYSVVEIVDHRSGRQNTWKECEATIDEINRTHSSAEPTPGSYSQVLQFKIASSIPPKPLAVLSWDDSIHTLQNLCESGVEAYLILDHNSFEDLLTHIRLFTALDPQPPVYVRCLMQSFLWRDSRVLDKFSYKEALFAAIEETTLPASNIIDLRNDYIEAPYDPRFIISRAMEQFARTATDAFLDVYVYQCMNRARLDRDLNKAIFTWDALEKKAEEIDNDLRPHNDFQILTPREDGKSFRSCPLKAWAARHKTRQMIWKVQTGFELDLYQPEELSSMYWILANLANSYMDLLIDTQAFNLHRLRGLLSHQVGRSVRITKVIEGLQNDIEEIKATYHLAAALSNLYALLTHLSLIPTPFHAPAFTTAEARYAQRVKAFLAVSNPPCPSFEQMSTLVSLHVDTLQSNHTASRKRLLSSSTHARALAILSLAEEEVKEAKKGWGQWLKKSPEQARCRSSEDRWKKDVQGILKSALGCIVVCANMRKELEKQGDLASVETKIIDLEVENELEITIPNATDRWHKAWVVPKVTAKRPGK